MVRPLGGIHIKAKEDLWWPYSKLPSVLNTAELLVDCIGQLSSLIQPWTSRKQLESNGRNSVQHGSGILSFWNSYTV